MKMKFKRIVTFVLFLCIIATLLPPVQITRAAEVTVRYELDTDGIDPGATYLIVNTGTAGSGNALRFYYDSYWSRDFRNQELTVKTEDGVTYIETGFTNEENCQFQFSAAGAGNITHGDYTLNLSDSNYVNGSPENTLTFTNVGNGQYRIHYTAWWSTYYLRYNNSDWERSTTSSSVYLFKLTEHVVGYDVTFDLNGATSGTLPENALMLSAGDVYTIPEPPVPLRKDIGEDTWLFLCWNTLPDGSGTEYRPGETITITDDVTLYADWYQQTKHGVTMLTYLDGTPTDVEKIAGYDRSFYAQLEGGDGTLIPLTRREEGTYGAKVVDNGTYIIYAQTADGAYEPVHGHKVVVYNQDGITECLHYSITYNTDGGVWAEGEAPTEDKCHDGETVIASETIPTKEGYRFIGWMDQDGNLRHPGHPITESADRKITVTAVWEKLITVTVNVMIDHNAASGGADSEQTMHDVSFILLREENGVNLPVDEKTLSTGYTYDPANNVTTYTVIFENMPQGIYHIRTSKDDYVETVVYTGNAAEDQTIDATLTYTPEDSDLYFNVVVNMDNEAEKALKPVAVNVKLVYWGHNEEDVLGWHIISKQEGDKVPSVVMIDENGYGTASYTIWPKRSGSDLPYEYRVVVTSFVMPDGTIVPATGDLETFTPDGSGLYTANVTVEGEGRVPEYPTGSDTGLSGAYFNGEQQMGVPTVTVEITPLTVTFDAGDGLVNGQQTVVLDNQYRYPALHDYVAVPNAADKVFICWTDENGNPLENQEEQLLAGNVTYYARYNDNITLSGTVAVDAVYEQDGQVVEIYGPDRVKKVQVVLQKRVGDIYNDIDSVIVELTYQNVEGYDHQLGLGDYKFTDLPNDGTEYRIHALTLNYNCLYDNNQDLTYTAEEAVAQIDERNAVAQVDVHLDFAPDTYQQAIYVDASRIQKDLRPTGVLAQILGRDLGDVHNYSVISQHTVAPYGIEIPFNSADATGIGFEDLWNWHTNGSPYEYQVQISTVYGNNVEGAYSEEGLPYTENSPFTITYGAPNNIFKQTAQGGVMLEAILKPKKYSVHLDLNLGNDPNTPVFGLEEYMVDDGTGNEHYEYIHTWSFADEFVAYPYREGYVFKGWTSPNTNEVYIKDGTIHVGSTLANDITLTAQWEELKGTDYSIRYLELNTDKVLQGATSVTGAALGDTVVAADKAALIEGYVYAGAMVDGKYIDKADNPVMTVSNDPTQNLMVIYYLPDGSDGYTEQVESNLEISKTATLEDDGTYTIVMDTYTKDNPITTLIQQNTPLDIVLVLDQSGSLAENDFEYLNALQDAVNSFVESVADHGRHNEVDHRIALVGYAGNETDAHSSDPVKATGGKTSDTWINTGVFDSNGEYHLYNVKGFNYTELTDTSTMTADGIYYTKVTSNGQDKYLLLRHHDEYRHLITEEEARVAVLQGETVFGYVYNEQDVGGFVELTRNSSGLWLYGDKQLYSLDEFFTYHTDVWTHRDGISPRVIHAYGVGAAYTPTDGHEGVYTRTETTGDSYQQSIYKDALIPVSVGAAGSGGTNPGLLKATQSFGADGATRASYGMEMANKILEANPVDDGEDRIRMVVMFTDGEPGYMGFDSSSGDEYYQQAVTEANNAISHAYVAKNTHKAHVYTIGLYESAGVEATSEVAYYMNALSSNYSAAQSMDDIKAATTYTQAADGKTLENNGKYFVLYNNTYYPVQYGYVRVSGSWRSQYCWYYTRNSTNYSISTATYPTVSGGKVGNYTIYQQSGGYAEADATGYYATTESPAQLKEYFENVLRDITTKITTQIILHKDTILRDIMGQGLVLTPGTVVTAYQEKGTMQDGQIVWSGNLEYVASAEIPENTPDRVNSKEVTTVSYTLDDGTEVVKENVPYIQIYNLNAANATDPDAPDYHPHTIDVTGYDFEHWFISDEHPEGYKMVVTVTRVEARDDVRWGVSTATNNEQSGLWLPADERGNRQLLLPFDQPTTIFVERAYVLDYGKEFELKGWYFDDEDGKDATPVHIDCDITNGMNWFDTKLPNVKNTVDSQYGNTKYGNVEIRKNEAGQDAVFYSPTTMNWGGYDQFYVFGNTWRKTVLAQDANSNGNLWNKVTVIPANNIYYEDSFITTESTTQNGIEGFTFTGSWTSAFTDDNEDNDGKNREDPEKQEDSQYGNVHGWTNDLADDTQYTDGSAHKTKEMGAQAEFTFTGTGVEVYTRTDNKSGMVVAVLYRNVEDANGNITSQFQESIAVDNLAMSGEYYHIPTVSFRKLPYGTYTLHLIATMAETEETGKRYEYYIDGVRVLNPLGNATNYQADVVKDAYGLEVNAVFTEVRDVLLDYGDFNTDLPDSEGGKMGAVFIDWIQKDQGSGNDTEDVGVPSYEVGTFEAYGPKNEVYLRAGQAIVLKVAEGNNYYIGLKSLTGAAVTANVSGIEQADPTAITLEHTTDMYYQVTPVNGYIVIQNGNADEAILSITNLRATNLTAPPANGGILPVEKQEAVTMMSDFSAYMLERENAEEPIPQPSDPEEEIPSAEEQAQANLLVANELFTSVRQWLETEKEESL